MGPVEKVSRVLSAVNALREVGGTIDISPASEAEFLQLAALLDATVRGHAVIYVDTPLLGAAWLYVFEVVRNGVTIHCQGTRPATAAEVQQASVCESEPPVTPERRAAALAKLAAKKCEHCLGSGRVWSKLIEGYEPCPDCSDRKAA